MCGFISGLSTLFHWGVAPQLADVDIHLLLGMNGTQSPNSMTTVIIAAFELLTEGYWFLDLCLGAAFVGVTVSATGEIIDQMEYSSMMKD